MKISRYAALGMQLPWRNRNTTFRQDYIDKVSMLAARAGVPKYVIYDVALGRLLHGLGMIPKPTWEYEGIVDLQAAADATKCAD